MAISVAHTTTVVVPDDGVSPVGSDEWNGTGAHTVSGVPTSSADNAVVRFDGTTGNIQSSGAFAYIDDSGRVLIGTDTSINTWDTANHLAMQIMGTTAGTAAIGVARFSADGNVPRLHLGKSRSGTIGTQAIVQNDEGVAIIVFEASDGVKFIPIGLIAANVAATGTVGVNNVPGVMDFSVNAGSSQASLMMRLKGDGSIRAIRNGFGVETGNGFGGTVTQATSKSTGVILNTVSGQITMNAAALAANTTVSFTLTNSKIEANDILLMNHISGGTAGSYLLNAQAAAGSASINVRNVTAGSLSEAIVIAFMVFKGSIS